ncbi:MAG TPA: TIR domain-containing protein [Armatimonadota bacterium]|nr:TIR domain-containing protein [Armatimonadota bacterium]
MSKRVESDIATVDVKKKRARVSQADIPRYPLAESLRIAEALINDFAGKSASPLSVAKSVGLSPASSYFRDLCGSSIAYDLTQGGAYADSISLTTLGRRIVASTVEGDDSSAKVEAVLKPRIVRDFFTQYDKAKFPSEKIAVNVLVTEKGVPRDRADEVLKLIVENGRAVGIIQEMKTGPWVSIGEAGTGPIEVNAGTSHERGEYLEAAVDLDTASGNGGSKPSFEPATKAMSNRVYLSHGKDRAIMDQVKEILKFGKFEPVVSVERESTAKPVPEKVFEDMRTCGAGVIHFMSEGELLDPTGDKVNRINENVLIEIGAAMALYRKNVVLLVEQGLNLPSNLQGLYKCEYTGDKLDYEATMKLLKTFNEFELG